ncbi:MAG: carboxylesterase family protein [Myxococcales bacterium]
MEPRADPEADEGGGEPSQDDASVQATPSDASFDSGDADAESDWPDAGDAGLGVVKGDELTIQLRPGVVHGQRVGNTRQFLGIPYAAPPVGELRFQAPRPREPWSDVFDATRPGPMCMQSGPSFGRETSEDCLSLNVYAPRADSSVNRPVMVFIHGGGFLTGAGSEYDGSTLSEAGGVIVVTLNYRLGALGFLHHAALDVAALGPHTNQGLRDQQQALRWVHDNIVAFGGDPQQVTLFGESAGAISTCAHLVAKGSDGFADRFIMESGNCAYGPLALQTKDYAIDVGNKVAAALCPGKDDVLACLRTLSSDQIAAQAIETTDPAVDGYYPFVDGDLFALAPSEAFKKGAFLRGDVMMGSNHAEWLLMQTLGQTTSPLNRTDLRNRITQYFSTDQAAQIQAHYVPVSDAEAGDAFLRLMTDAYFRCPARTLMRAMVSHGRKGYLYDFQVEPAAHALEVDYLFNMTAVSWLFPFSAPIPPTASVVRAMQHYWTGFAEDGNPHPAGLPAWPGYDQDSDQNLVLADTISTNSGLARADCDFWAKLWGAASGP